MGKKRFLVGGGAGLLATAAFLSAGGIARAAWQAATPLPVAYLDTKTVAANGHVYKIGGLGDKGICGVGDVLYAPLNTDGSVGAWTPTTSLPNVGTSTLTWTCAGVAYTMSDIVIGWGYEAVYANGFIYILGGNRWNFNGFPDGSRIHFSSEVYYAPVNADGSLGAWVKGTSLSTASFNAAATAVNGVIYVTGGRDDSSTTNVRRDTFYARLNADGSLPAWRSSAFPLPGGLWLHSAQAAGGRLYVSGGVTYDPFPRDQITNAVFSAPLAADGAPGAWRAEATLPIGLAGHAMRERHGLLYTVGGQEPSLPSVSVHVSTPAPDGSLAAWSDADALPVPLYMHGVSAYGDALYADGGSDGSTGQKSVYRLPDTVPPSAVADLAAAPLDSASLRLSWSAPGNDGSRGSTAGGTYYLRSATDPSLLGAAAPTAWTASFDPGAPQFTRLAGLAPGATYYFSLQSADSAGNLSPLSNAASAQTYFLAVSTETPPLARLESPAAGLAISALSDAQSAPLLAGAPGAAAAPLYQIQPQAALAPGLLSVSFPPASLAAGLALYVYQNGVGWSSAAATSQTVDASSYVARATIAHTGTFGLFGPYPVPAVGALAPSLLDAGSGAFTLTVDGAGFARGSVVQWNGAARATTFVSASRLTAAVAASDLAAPGAASVTVFTPPPGGGASAPATFTIGNPLPSLSALSPASAGAGSGGFTLTANGSNFVPGAAVQWNGAARATTFVSATQLTAAIPASDDSAVGVAMVSVSNPAPGGGAAPALAFSVVNPVPSVAGLSPASAAAGGAAFALTVNGAGFVSGSTVQWNGSPRATTFVSAGQLTAAVSAADVAAAGAASVTVFTPAPGGGTSAAAAFAILNPAPLASSLSPASAVAGGAAFALTLNGSGFVSGSTVQWNGAARATTFVSTTQLTAAISAADVAAAGSAVVTVFTPAPGGGTSSPLTFTANNPVPAVSGLSPGGATAGAAAFTLTVNGAGFVGGSTVQWNGAARATTFVSAGQLTAAIPAADAASAGTDAVTVVSPAPGGGPSAPASFTVANPAPAIAALSPASAVAGGAAFALTVNGAGFVSGSTVQWNGSPRATTFVSAGQLTAAVSAADVAAAGAASVSVFTPAPGGGTSAAAAFAIAVPPPLAPLVASISPAGATAGDAGFVLVVNGSNFTASSTVQWNGAARATTFVSATQLTAAISAADVSSAGAENVAVFTPPPGGGTSSPAGFTVANPAPAIAALSPASAVAGGAAFALTVNGSGFVSGSVVQWNGSPRATTFVSATHLTASVAAADVAAGGAQAVTVVSPAPGGGASAAATFTVANPAPAIAALSPAAVVAGGPGLSISVLGSGFVPASAAQWNGAPRAAVFVSTSQLTIALSSSDVAAAGSAGVVVVSPAPGGGASAAAAFTVANPAPALASVSPSSAAAGAPGFALTVNGSGFVSGSVVEWNGAPRATSFVSAAQLTAAISSADVAAAGADSVSVFTPAPGGGLSAAASFAVTAVAGGGDGDRDRHGDGDDRRGDGDGRRDDDHSRWPAPSFSAAFEPRTLDLDSRGGSVQVVIEARSWASEDDVVAASVKLAAVDGRAVAALSPLGGRRGDHDGDGREDDAFAFDRSAVAALLSPGEHALTFSGALTDGRSFSASASVDATRPSDGGGGGHGVSALSVRAAAPRPAGEAPRFWPAPPQILAQRTMAWDADVPFAPVKQAVTVGRAAVRVPQGAVDPAVVLTVSTAAAAAAPDAPARAAKLQSAGLTAAAPAVVFGPEGTRFATPVTLELPYDRRALAPGTDESLLAVHYWNPATSQWEKLPSFVDRDAQIVRAQTPHFSLYQLLLVPPAAAPISIPAAADPAFGIKSAYAFPNPARGGSVTIRVQPGQADSVSVRVYDLSGRRVHESSNFDPHGGAAFDDGNGAGPQFTYDHVWDVTGVGSGVYTYVITATKSGQSDVHKTGRLAVVK